jgi:hypothetical protein
MSPALSRNSGFGFRIHTNHWLHIGFPESHAAAIRHTVITVEKTMGTVKANLQLRAVT